MAWKPNYATDDELKHYLRIPAGDTDDDAEIGFAITASSRAIDTATNRQFGLATAAENRYYTARWSKTLRRWIIETDDFQTAVGLTVFADLDDDETYSYEIDSYKKRPVNAAANGRPWEYIVVNPDSTNLPNGKEAAVRVFVQFGWSAVPTIVKQASLLQGSRFFWRRNAPAGVAGSPDSGTELRLLSKVDPDVDVMLRDVKRFWGAV